MSATLRGLLIVASIVTVIWILRNIRKFKVKMEDAIFWTFFGAILLVFALVPELSIELSHMLGFISPANLIYVVIIFLLLEKIFTLSIIVSQLEEKVSILSAEVALRSHSADRRLDKIEENMEKDSMTGKTYEESCIRKSENRKSDKMADQV